MGELLAILSAMFYGLASVAISKGRHTASGDNGVFLSIVVTCGLSMLLWFFWGAIGLAQLMAPEAFKGLAFFVIAGFLSTVLGRSTMYRATERIGAVKTSLIRRLIPVFTVLTSVLLLGQWPDTKLLLGGALILSGVLLYHVLASRRLSTGMGTGELIAVASAVSYATAYTFRSYGMQDLADPLLGTFVGAAFGLGWLSVRAMISRSPEESFYQLICDRGLWHWTSAWALGFGQTLQFFALSRASVSTVAFLGALDLFFAAGLVAILGGGEKLYPILLAGCGGAAVVGSAILLV